MTEATPAATPVPAASPETPAPAAESTSSAWHAGVDPVMLGFWQNKGWDPADPKKVAEGLTKAYREVERFVGAPPDEMLRIPKPNAATADINAYWQRVGVPSEAKDYDLSSVKFTDGKDLDAGFVDMFRAAAHGARVPKDQAAGMLAQLVKHMETNDAAELANKTAYVKTQQEVLEKNWGQNKTYNMAIAQRALEDLGKSLGWDAARATRAWDALTKIGGVDASDATEMLRQIGARMGESKFISSQPGQGGNNAAMSRQQALAEIEALKADKVFYRQLMDKNVEAHRRWGDLHKVAYAA